MKRLCTTAAGLLILTTLLSAQDRTVSVIPLTTSSGVGKAELQVITEYLESGLINTGEFDVIASDQREAILGEQTFSLGGCSDQSCALEIGKLLSAQYMVFGSVNRQAGSYILSVKKVNVETSKIDTNAIDTMLTLSASQIEETTLKLAHELAGLEWESAQESLGSYTGRVRIMVRPVEAKAVFNLSTELDGYPEVLEDVPVGEYPLRVSLEGFETELVSVKVEKGETTEILVSLKRKTGPVERPPVGKGFLTIYTSPPGMQVELDFNVLEDRTPIENLPIDAGEHQVAVGDFTDFYYKTMDTFVTVEAGKSIELPMELERSLGTLLVRCTEDDAAVYVNGKKEGMIRGGQIQIRNIPTGRIEVTVMKDRYYPKTMELDLRPSKRAEVMVDLRPEPVRVVIDSNPAGAEVYFDGRTIGKTPTLTEDVSQGSHRYYLEYNGYRTEERTLRVRGTEDKTIIEDLTSPVRVNLKDRNDLEAAVYVDGHFVGETEGGDLRIEGVGYGRHEVEIRKSGYATVLRNIVVKEEPFILREDLRLQDIRFSVMTEPGGATVLVNGQPQEGLTPMTIELSEGRHEVVIRKKGYLPVTEVVVVDSPRGMRIRKALVEGEDEDVLLAYYRDEMEQLENPDAGIFTSRRIAGDISSLGGELESYALDVSRIRDFLDEKTGYYRDRAESLEATAGLMRERIEALTAERDAATAERGKMMLFEGLSILGVGGAAAGTYFAITEMLEAKGLYDAAELTMEAEEHRSRASLFGWLGAAGAATAGAGTVTAFVLPGKMKSLKTDIEDFTRDISASAGILARIESTRNGESTIDAATVSFSLTLSSFAGEIADVITSGEWGKALDLIESAGEKGIITTLDERQFSEQIREGLEKAFNGCLETGDLAAAEFQLEADAVSLLWTGRRISEAHRQIDDERNHRQSLADEEKRREAARFDDVAVDVWNIPFMISNLTPDFTDYLIWSVELAEREINRSGGIAGKPLNLEVTVYGDRGSLSPMDVAETMVKLIEQEPLCILGPAYAWAAEDALGLSSAMGVYCLTALADYESVEDFFPWALASRSPVGEVEIRVARAWAGLYADKPDRVAIRTEGFINPMVNIGFKQGLVDAGIDPDNIGIDTPLKGSPTDGFIFNTQSGYALNALRALKDMGLEMNRILLTPYCDNPDIYTIGGPVLDGVMVWNYYDQNHDSDRWRGYRDEAPGHGRYVLPAFYDAVYMLKEAIEETGITGDPERLYEEQILIRDYCNNIQDFEGIQHTWSNKDGVPVDKPVYLFEIWGLKKSLLKIVQ